MILNFNVLTQDTQVLYRSGGSLSFRSRSEVFLFEDMFISEEEKTALKNTIGFYKYKNFNFDDWGPPFGPRYSNSIDIEGYKLNYWIDTLLFHTGSNGAICLQDEIKNQDVRRLFTDLGRSVNEVLREKLVKMTEEASFKPPKKKERSFIDGILYMITGYDTEEVDTSEPIEKVWWKTVVVDNLDLTNLVYDRFKKDIYEPTRGNPGIENMFSNYLLVFSIRMRDTEKERK